MRVLAISGSLRTTSSNAALLRAAESVLPPGAEMVLYEGLAGLPHFSPDIDTDPLPPAVVDFRAQITAVDAIVISSPEYAHGIPGSLKNALDWLVSALESIGKPFLLVSASPSGAYFVHAHLMEVLSTMATQVIDGGAHVFSRHKVDASGGIMVPSLIEAFRAGFVKLEAACIELAEAASA